MNFSRSLPDWLDLSGRVVVVTGGGGLLGSQHAEVIAELGGHPVLVDLKIDQSHELVEGIQQKYGVSALAVAADITSEDAVREVLNTVIKSYGRVDGLINNAANNPKVESGENSDSSWSRLESYPLNLWAQDLAVGLTGALICSRVVGSHMALQGHGVIINIASDLGVIAPDQRIYADPEMPVEQQPVKPVSYSVVKHGIIGMTKYLATYWADSGVRVNAISPGGIYNDQPEDFVQRLTNLIPVGRMARHDEYKGTIAFLLADASSYMTGANVVVDGGRTVW